jgi:hypothetical protein
VDRPAVRPVTGPDGPVIDLGEPAHAHVKVAKAVPAPELVGAGQTSGQLCPSG